MRFDAVVIGSGLGGLEVALGLAKRGMKVVVLERQKHAGGCMQSFRRGEMNLDTGLHYVGALGEGESLNTEFEKYGLMDLPWKKMNPDGFEEIYTGGKVYRWKMGLENFIGGMKEYFPHESEGLDRFREMMLSKDDAWLMNTSCRAYLDSIIDDETLKEVLIAPAMCKMELRSETLPLFTYQHGIAPFIESSWRLDGDGNMIVDCLSEQIRNLGGDVLTRKDVVELHESDGHIQEAVTADGESFSADWFVCDVHPAAMCSMVKESTMMKNIFRLRMQRQANTTGMFTTHLCLKEGALDYFNSNRIILCGETCWDYAVGCDLKVRNVMTSCRTNGKNVDILTPMQWSVVEPFASSTRHNRPEEYELMKAKVADGCITLAEKAIPGLKDMIDKVWTSTPLTYRDYNNTPEGSAFGFRKDFNNPLMTIISPKTPIPNLLMTGQSLMLHGLQGVTMTASFTLNEVKTEN